MSGEKHDIIKQLERDILPLQGYKPVTGGAGTRLGLPGLEAAFPRGCWPTGAVHEFLVGDGPQRAATVGFAGAVMGRLMAEGGVSVWVSRGQLIFPPGLAALGVAAERILFIDVREDKDVPRVMEEALKVEGVAAVVGELRAVDMAMSRRLQLAVEQSRTTGFVLRNEPKIITPMASVARWRVAMRPGSVEEGMPGVGAPRWRLELLKVRNGRPAVWEVEWVGGRLREIAPGADAGREGKLSPGVYHQKRKAG